MEMFEVRKLGTADLHITDGDKWREKFKGKKR